MGAPLRNFRKPYLIFDNHKTENFVFHIFLQENLQKTIKVIKDIDIQIKSCYNYPKSTNIILTGGYTMKQFKKALSVFL